MINYNPERFASLFNTEHGHSLLAFLTEETSIAAMKTASDLGKPAIVGVRQALLEEFNQHLLENRFKQMAGHMVRQVMESEGYTLAQDDVSVRAIPFIKAARYARLGHITYYAFRSSVDPRDVCVTDRLKDVALPDDVRWLHYTTFSTPLEASIGFDIRDFSAMQEDVRENGYRQVRVERMMRAG
jgi:hypothetical protein